MNLLVAFWVFGVDIDLIVSKDNALGWFFIKNDTQWNQLFFLTYEESMLFHLVPIWPFGGIILHCVIQEIEAL